MMSDDAFDTPGKINVLREFADKIKLASEFVIEEPTLLEPGLYVVILGELRKPIYLKPLFDNADSNDL